MAVLIEDAATVLIIVMAGWVCLLFWRAYRQAGAPSNLLLSAVFALVCAYKLAQFVLEVLFRVKALAWMDSEVASEGLIIILAVVIVVVLAGVGATRRTAGGRR